MVKWDYEAFKAEILPLYIAIGVLALGWNLFSYYTPTWQTEIGPQTIWTIIGILLLAVGSISVGAASWLRHHTRKLFAGNRMFQLAFPDPITVEVTDFNINEGALAKQLTTEEQVDVDLVKSSAPGTNEMGAKVATRVLLPGGIDAGGFKSFSGGSQGMIIMSGDDEMIRLDQCTFIPHVLKALDHTQVPVEVLELAEKQSHFVRGKMPIYVTAGLDPKVDGWMRTSVLAQATILQAIGFNGLIDRFAIRLNRLVADRRLTAITPVRNSDGKLVIPREVMAALRNEFTTYLKDQKPLMLALGRNHAGETHWKLKYYGLLSEFNLSQARIRQKDHTIYEHDKAQAGYAADRSATYGGGGPTAPGYDLSANRPARATVE